MTWKERWHALRKEWIMVAAHRQDRPWSGNVVARSVSETLRDDPSCYPCPGNRAGGKHTEAARS